MIIPKGAQLRADLTRALNDAGEEALPGILDALSIHLSLLARWNRSYGLTRIDRWEEILDRHVGESLLPLRWIPSASMEQLLDIGSGNGYPAIPILICRPNLKGTLVERSEKTALFLDAVVREIGMGGVEIAVEDLGPAGKHGHASPGRDASVIDARRHASGSVKGPDSARRATCEGSPVISSIRDGGLQPATDSFDYVISRATLAPEKLIGVARSWVRPGGRIFVYGSSELTQGGDPGIKGGEGRESPSEGLRTVARERIPGRKASFLWVLDSLI